MEETNINTNFKTTQNLQNLLVYIVCFEYFMIPKSLKKTKILNKKNESFQILFQTLNKFVDSQEKQKNLYVNKLI